MRYQFVAEHQDTFPVVRLCQVLDVSPSGYYAWRKRPTSQREMANRELLREIRIAIKPATERMAVHAFTRKSGSALPVAKIVWLVS